MHIVKEPTIGAAGTGVQPKLPWNKAINVTCKCGNNLFKDSYIIKKFNKTIIETPGEIRFPEDQFVPISVMVCTKCEKILETILPEEIKEIL